MGNTPYNIVVSPPANLYNNNVCVVDPVSNQTVCYNSGYPQYYAYPQPYPYYIFNNEENGRGFNRGFNRPRVSFNENVRGENQGRSFQGIVGRGGGGGGGGHGGGGGGRGGGGGHGGGGHGGGGRMRKTNVAEKVDALLKTKWKGKLKSHSKK